MALGISVIAASLLHICRPAGNADANRQIRAGISVLPAAHLGSASIWTARRGIGVVPRLGHSGWGTASAWSVRAPALHQSLIALQTFMGVAAALSSCSVPAFSERRRAENGMRLAHARAAEANRPRRSSWR